MDVQAAAATVLPTSLPPSAPPPVPGSLPTIPAPAAVSTAPAVSPPSDSDASSSKSSNPQIAALPGFASLPPSSPANIKPQTEATISAGVAKLFNAAEQNVSVSFQVAGPNEIVTVFTDKTTGKVIVQFPSETLIALGKFLDKLDGSVVNKKV